eukprot:Sdes_comp9442_c0_seq1m907
MRLQENPTVHFSEWEELRKQTRNLENEVDAKLVSLSKFDMRNARDFTPDKNVGWTHNFEDPCLEMEQMLQKLSNYNDRIRNYVESKPNNSTMVHHFQRHRDILNNYTQEFRNLKQSITKIRERQDLIPSIQRITDQYQNHQKLNSSEQIYSDEQNRIMNSSRVTDQTIQIALETRDQLHFQKQTFRDVKSRVQYLSTRFPILTSLVKKIHFRKRRDSFILAFVISFCIILLFLYLR